MGAGYLASLGIDMHGMLIALALVGGTIATAEGASPHAIQPSDICAGATLIDFETATTALPVVPGVTFVDSGSPVNPPWFGGGGVFTSVPPFGGVFGTEIYSNQLSSITADLAVQFLPATQAVGAYIGAFNAPPVPTHITFRAFDASDNLIYSVVSPLPQLGGTARFVGVSYPPGIARIEWLGGNDGPFGVDNLVFGRSCAPLTSAASVPVADPKWLVLLSVLVLLVAVFERKRRVKHSVDP